jgi:hypothetical protein
MDDRHFNYITKKKPKQKKTEKMENLFLNSGFLGFFSRRIWIFFLGLIASCYPNSLQLVATKIYGWQNNYLHIF